MVPKQSTRNRVLSACSTCQSRRVKCTKNPRNVRCDLCERINVDCVFLPDGRRRPISRTEVDSLNSRIQSLEAMLRSQATTGTAAATSSSSTKRSQPGSTPPADLSSRTLPDANPLNTTERNETPSAPRCGDPRDRSRAPQSEQQSNSHLSFDAGQRGSPQGNSPDSSLAEVMSEGPSKALIDRLISPSDSVPYDLSSGSLRHASPIIAFHQFSELKPNTTKSSSREQDRRIERILRDLSPETHDHLMESFWSYYDPVMQVVDREVFEEDRKAGRELTYSGFLHICILSMGYRYADAKRPDIQRLALPNKESTLHREAKYLVEFELENPGKIPSVQALLILGQLESGCGRDAAGWIYAGVAFRSALDIGLDIDCSKLNLTKREQRARSFTLEACTAFDRLWAIYLGRSRSLQSSSTNRYGYLNQSQKFQGHYHNTGMAHVSIEKQCFDALLELLDLSARIIELLYSRQDALQRSDYLVIAGLDAGLNAWYGRLPETLAWTPSNIETAPLSYFHLHSQYHASLVLLHRPFALYERSEQNTGGTNITLTSSLSTIAKDICIEHALKTVHILSLQLQRFDAARFPQAQLQHIGTAVAVLISSIAVSRETEERIRLLEPLHSLARIAQAISATYTPAEMISDVLENLLKEPGWNFKSMGNMEQDDIMRDVTYMTSTSKAGHLASTMGTNREHENIPQFHHIGQDCNFTFERDEGLDILAGFGEGGMGFGSAGGLPTTLIGLSPLGSQQIAGDADLPRMPYGLPMTL